jgi:hypothetical protein
MSMIKILHLVPGYAADNGAINGSFGVFRINECGMTLQNTWRERRPIGTSAAENDLFEKDR